MKDSLFSKNKIPFALTIAVLIAGTIFYLLADQRSTTNMEVSATMLSDNDLQLKVAYTTNGDIKLFALGKNNLLSQLKTDQGSPIPEYNTVVIGANEASTMVSEGLFKQAGEQLNNLFGTNVLVGGILSQTNSPVDDFHFITDANFAALEGESNRVFVKVTDEGMAKLFYALPINEINKTKIRLPIAEGSMEYYTMNSLAGITYYPVLLGSEEAKIMREENLFVNVGDTIRGFFANDVVIIGILEPTNTPLDMMHITPLEQADINERRILVKNDG